MNHVLMARASVGARHITENAEFAKIAEHGDDARAFTNLLRVLGVLRALGDSAGRGGWNAPGRKTCP
jgi:hypothetical protein